MAVNNEIGVIQDLAAIGAIARAAGALFHTDAAQAAGRIGLDVEEIRADLMSLSAHKIYGPKGIGALYVRRRPRVRIAPLVSGGGQERGLRSGTLPAPLVVGFGEAARIAAGEGLLDAGRIAGQRESSSPRSPPPCRAGVNAPEAPRVAGNLNIAFPGGVSRRRSWRPRRRSASRPIGLFLGRGGTVYVLRRSAWRRRGRGHLADWHRTH